MRTHEYLGAVKCHKTMQRFSNTENHCTEINFMRIAESREINDKRTQEVLHSIQAAPLNSESSKC